MVTGNMSREEKIAKAKYKISKAPFGLKWFKFFKYVVLILHCVVSGFSILSLTSTEIFYLSQLMEYNLSEKTIALILIIDVINLLIQVADIVLPILLFRRLSELDIKAYRLLKIYLVFLVTTNIFSRIISVLYMFIIYDTLNIGRNIGGIILPEIIGIIWSVVWFLLNYVYFKNRYVMFTDEWLRPVAYDEREYAHSLKVSLDQNGNPVVICPYCNSQVPADCMFCAYCGRNFT